MFIVSSLRFASSPAGHHPARVCALSTGLLIIGGWAALLPSMRGQGCPVSCPEFCDVELGSGQYSADFCHYPITGCRPGDGVANAGCCCPTSPIVVDVDGDGYDLTSAEEGVDFDIGNDGRPDRVAWTSAGSDDSWLVLDRNHNGIVDNGTELFGNFTPQLRSKNVEPNGFIALAEYDKPYNGGNGDGSIDEHDRIFGELRLWRDENHNGVSESTELSTLANAGVTGISLDYKESRMVDRFGNAFRYRARVEKHRGSEAARWAWDVYLTRP